MFCFLYAARLLGCAQIAWPEAFGFVVTGVAPLTSAVRHLSHSHHPMVDPSSLKVPTIAFTVWGGSLFRMGVGAVPFLLPVMYQREFGSTLSALTLC